MQQELLYVYQVYLEGSFSKAAEKLFLTQPALSIAIQRIETAIGMPLFDRSRRPLQLTAAGEVYIDSIKKMINLENDLKQQINNIQDLKTGTIRIGGSHYLNAYILPDLLQGFNQKYPGIHFEIVEAGSNVLADMLTERKIDLTFSCNTTFLRDFERYPLFQDHILLAVPNSFSINKEHSDQALSASDIISQRHLQDDCPSVSLSSFCDLEYILLTQGNNLYDRAICLFNSAGFTPRIKLQLSQQITAFHLTIAEYGATFVSDRSVRDPNIPVVFYKVDSEECNRQFYILLPDKTYTSNATQTFIRYLQENIT